MNKVIFLFLICGFAFGQTLPKKDNGFCISYNYSQRYLESHKIGETEPIFFPTVDYKKNYNINQKLSVKTGLSLFIAGHQNITYYDYEYTDRHYYLRIPLLCSFNKKSFYFDIGTSILFRFWAESNDYNTSPSRGGEELGLLGISETIEMHFGKYIPIKSRRMFFEIACYGSELYSNVIFPDNYRESKSKIFITNNVQISIGMMFNKNKALAKTTE